MEKNNNKLLCPFTRDCNASPSFSFLILSSFLKTPCKRFRNTHLKLRKTKPMFWELCLLWQYGRDKEAAEKQQVLSCPEGRFGNCIFLSSDDRKEIILEEKEVKDSHVLHHLFNCWNPSYSKRGQKRMFNLPDHTCICFSWEILKEETERSLYLLWLLSLLWTQTQGLCYRIHKTEPLLDLFQQKKEIERTQSSNRQINICLCLEILDSFFTFKDIIPFFPGFHLPYFCKGHP